MVSIKKFANGNANITLGSGRLVKLPASEVASMEQLQIHSRMISHYRNSEFLCSGNGEMHKTWQKYKADPRFCRPHVSTLEYCEILEAFGGREVATLRTFSGVNLLPGSEPFRRFRRDHHPGLGSHAPRERLPAGGARLNRGSQTS